MLQELANMCEMHPRDLVGWYTWNPAQSAEWADYAWGVVTEVGKYQTEIGQHEWIIHIRRVDDLHKPPKRGVYYCLTERILDEQPHGWMFWRHEWQRPAPPSGR